MIVHQGSLVFSGGQVVVCEVAALLFQEPIVQFNALFSVVTERSIRKKNSLNPNATNFSIVPVPVHFGSLNEEKDLKLNIYLDVQ